MIIMKIFGYIKTNMVMAMALGTLVLPGVSIAKDKSELKLGKPGNYNQAIVLVSDGQFDSLDQARVPDPGFTFLRDDLGMTDDEIEAFITSREAQFRDRFGIDFSDVPWVNGIKNIPGVGNLMIGRFTPAIEYRAIYMNGRGVDLPVKAGGIFLTVMDMGVVYHGEYGGVAGKPAFPGDLIVSGFYLIERKNGRKSHIISFDQGDAPTRFTFEGWNIFTNTLSSQMWGDGISDGAATIEPQADGRFHSVIRNVLTFPGRLTDASLLKVK